MAKHEIRTGIGIVRHGIGELVVATSLSEFAEVSSLEGHKHLPRFVSLNILYNGIDTTRNSFGQPSHPIPPEIGRLAMAYGLTDLDIGLPSFKRVIHREQPEQYKDREIQSHYILALMKWYGSVTNAPFWGIVQGNEFATLKKIEQARRKKAERAAQKTFSALP